MRGHTGHPGNAGNTRDPGHPGHAKGIGAQGLGDQGGHRGTGWVHEVNGPEAGHEVEVRAGELRPEEHRAEEHQEEVTSPTHPERGACTAPDSCAFRDIDAWVSNVHVDHGRWQTTGLRR